MRTTSGPVSLMVFDSGTHASALEQQCRRTRSPTSASLVQSLNQQQRDLPTPPPPPPPQRQLLTDYAERKAIHVLQQFETLKQQNEREGLHSAKWCNGELCRRGCVTQAPTAHVGQQGHQSDGCFGQAVNDLLLVAGIVATG